MPLTVRIASGHHRLEIVAGDGAEFNVDGKARVTHSNGSVTVDEPTSRLRVTVPSGTNLVIGSTSGRVSTKGLLGDVAVVSESGRIDVESAGSLDARAESGAVDVGTITGSCCIRSKSGRVDVEQCGSANVASKSGRVELHHVDGEVDAHSVSGRIELNLTQPHDVRAETVTGRIEVSLPRGTVAFQPVDVSDTRLRPPNAECTVTARSETGKVVVTTR